MSQIRNEYFAAPQSESGQLTCEYCSSDLRRIRIAFAFAGSMNLALDSIVSYNKSCFNTLLCIWSNYSLKPYTYLFARDRPDPFWGQADSESGKMWVF